MKQFKRMPAAMVSAGALLLAVVAPVSADGFCPPQFEVATAPAPVNVLWADRNGDGLQCQRLLTPQNRLIFVSLDNNVPLELTPGVTSEGDSLVVDTETGAIAD
jgi:hypothetical protein